MRKGDFCRYEFDIKRTASIIVWKARHCLIVVLNKVETNLWFAQADLNRLLRAGCKTLSDVTHRYGAMLPRTYARFFLGSGRREIFSPFLCSLANLGFTSVT